MAENVTSTCRDCSKPRVRGFATCTDHGAIVTPELFVTLPDDEYDDYDGSDLDDFDADYEADRAADHYERWLYS